MADRRIEYRCDDGHEEITYWGTVAEWNTGNTYSHLCPVCSLRNEMRSEVKSLTDGLNELRERVADLCKLQPIVDALSVEETEATLGYDGGPKTEEHVKG